MARTKTIIIGCVAVIGVVVLTCGASAIYNQVYQRTTPTIPDYPNASNVRHTPRDKALPDAGGLVTTTYQTADSSATVYRFYRTQLTPLGLQRWDKVIDGEAYRRRSCPYYSLVVYAMQESPADVTDVTVEISAYQCS